MSGKGSADNLKMLPGIPGYEQPMEMIMKKGKLIYVVRYWKIYRKRTNQ